MLTVPVSYLSSLHKLSLKQYSQMIEHGILNEDSKIELLDGYLVERLQRSPLHNGTIDIVSSCLHPVMPPAWNYRILCSLEFDQSQPEPDFAIVRGNSRTYVVRHPRGEDVGLIIEVSEKSLERDRIDKARIYARAGIVEYWIVNLVDRQIEVHTLPVGESYTNVQNYTAGQSLPLTLDGVVVATIPFEEMMP